MNMYPALRSQMGTWDYYVVKMNTRQLSQNVKFAYEVHDDRTLDRAIQRTLDESRVKKDIVEYLKRQPHRFFSSIVVAALNGNPQFHAVEISEDPRFAMLRNNHRLNQTFGVLQFDGTQDYYALDGQHRLSAIKTLLDPSELNETPADFADDEISVIVVVPNQDDSKDTFLQKYRRLFSSLNRYAKPMDQATNIIMDEDDTFAILTRRLITEHTFFHSDVQRQRESEKIKTEKGKNLKTGDSYFTSLETLYDMNTKLLSSAIRNFMGWGPQAETAVNLETFKRFRPPEEYLDSLYDELVLYWDGLLAELPILRSDPMKMRYHEEADRRARDGMDHLLFWPIGQEMLAKITRRLLDQRLREPENPTSDTVQFALKGLGKLQWELNRAPWQYFVVIRGKAKWAMRNEQRSKVIECGSRIQRWMLGLKDRNDGDPKPEDLKREWRQYLIPALPDDVVDELWRQVEERKAIMPW